MKLLLGLVVVCITLVFCSGQCFTSLPEVQTVNGKQVPPNGCVDHSDGIKHPLRSRWNSSNCMRCSCGRNGEMTCCSRFGGVAVVEGCKAVKDYETCKYKFYRLDDPSQPCFVSAS